MTNQAQWARALERHGHAVTVNHEGTVQATSVANLERYEIGHRADSVRWPRIRREETRRWTT